MSWLGFGIEAISSLICERRGSDSESSIEKESWEGRGGEPREGARAGWVTHYSSPGPWKTSFMHSSFLFL